MLKQILHPHIILATWHFHETVKLKAFTLHTLLKAITHLFIGAITKVTT